MGWGSDSSVDDADSMDSGYDTSSVGSGTSTDTSGGSDNNNDNDGFFSGTFDNPGEPGFTGPSYEGQYGVDNMGDYWDPGFTDTADWYEFSKFERALDKIDKIQNTGFNFNKDYAVMDAYSDVRGFDPRGGRYGADDAAFFSRAIGEYGIAGDIYSTVDRTTGFGATVRRGFEGLANGIAERFGTSLTRDYTVIPGQGYVGEVFEDYSGTDAIGNLLGMVVPGGARVDRYMSRELTGTGKGAMAFGEAKAFYGAIDTQYAMTPAEEEAMFAEQRAADEAERARGGGDASVATVPERVTGTVVRPRSALLGSLLGDTARPEYNIVAPYATDAFSYFTGGMRDYFGFAEGGEVPGAQMGGEAEPVTGPLGFVGGPPEQMSDAETVADDVPVEVQEGAYVLNAAAVEYMGSADVKNMILNAMQELKAQGVDKAQDVDKIELDTQVSLLVSKGEVLIPPQVAEVIGYDRLEKINKRGLRETQKRVEENGQSPEAEALDQQPANPAEGMAMAKGGESFIRRAYKTIPTNVRLLLEYMVGSDSPITEKDFTEEELKEMSAAIEKQRGKNVDRETQLREMVESGKPYKQLEIPKGLEDPIYRTEFFGDTKPVYVDFKGNFVDQNFVDEIEKNKEFRDALMERAKEALGSYENTRDTVTVGGQGYYRHDVERPQGYEGFVDKLNDPRYQVQTTVGKFKAKDSEDRSGYTVTDTYDFNSGELGYESNEDITLMDIWYERETPQMMAELMARYLRPEGGRPVEINLERSKEPDSPTMASGGFVSKSK
jgi:hypothetical protein